MAYRKCHRCDGNGYFPCPRCGGGDGKIMGSTCYYCDGRKVFRCDICNGTGLISE